MARTRFSLLALLAVGAVAADALAQDVATAEALFNKGLADMQASKFDTGCPAIAESYRLDPRAGTLFTLAECEAKAGHFATASARYDDYLSLYSRMTPEQQAKQKGRDKVAKEQKDALAPMIPLLTLQLPKTAPKDTSVKRDDVVLGAVSIGLALPVNPGEHVIVTQVPGGPAVEKKITIAKGEKKTVDLEVKLPQAAPTAQATASAPPPATGALAPSSAPSSEPPPPADKGSGQRTAAFVAGGVGIAGLALGGIMGAMVLGKKSDIDAHCIDIHCDHDGKAAADSAKTLGLVSTIGFGVGIAGLGASAVLFLTAPKAAKTGAAKTWVTAGVTSTTDGARAVVRGAW
jgi:hypothetical protein